MGGLRMDIEYQHCQENPVLTRVSDGVVRDAAEKARYLDPDQILHFADETCRCGTDGPSDGLRYCGCVHIHNPMPFKNKHKAAT